MLTLAEICRRIDECCPFRWQEDFDNSGLQVGNPNKPCKRLLLALDMRQEVLEEAIAKQVDLIITHHPMLFHAIKSVDATSYQGKMIFDLIKHDIGLLSLHTSLDKAPFGVNHALGQVLGLENGRLWLEEEERCGFGYRGELPQAMPLLEFATDVKKRLQMPAIRYQGETDRSVRSVAVMGGGGASYLEQAANDGVDVYISSDFKYSDGQRGLELSLCLIDGGHYATEVVVMEALRGTLDQILDGETEQVISENNRDYWQYL